MLSAMVMPAMAIYLLLDDPAMRPSFLDNPEDMFKSFGVGPITGGTGRKEQPGD